MKSKIGKTAAWSIIIGVVMGVVVALGAATGVPSGIFAVAFAGDPTASPTGSDPSLARSKVIRFDDNKIESMDKLNLDSVVLHSEKMEEKNTHLFKKRENFKLEHQQLNDELVYGP